MNAGYDIFRFTCSYAIAFIAGRCLVSILNMSALLSFRSAKSIASSRRLLNGPLASSLLASLTFLNLSAFLISTLTVIILSLSFHTDFSLCFCTYPRYTATVLESASSGPYVAIISFAIDLNVSAASSCTVITCSLNFSAFLASISSGLSETTSSNDMPAFISISLIISISYLLYTVTQTPSLPARPVRPDRCIYDSTS